jgi:hypothetical protein
MYFFIFFCSLTSVHPVGLKTPALVKLAISQPSGAVAAAQLASAGGGWRQQPT